MPQGGIKIGGKEIRRDEGACFQGVWVDEGLSWMGQIDQLTAKVGWLLGVLGSVGAVLGGRIAISSQISVRICSFQGRFWP